MTKQNELLVIILRADTMDNEGPMLNHQFAMDLYNTAKTLDPGRLVSTSDGTAKTPKVSRKKSSFRPTLGLFSVNTMILSGHHSRFGTIPGNVFACFWPTIRWKMDIELCYIYSPE